MRLLLQRPYNAQGTQAIVEALKSAPHLKASKAPWWCLTRDPRQAPSSPWNTLDNWHPKWPLMLKFGSRFICNTGSTLNEKLYFVPHEGNWVGILLDKVCFSYKVDTVEFIL